jgi:structural maintenance of chromosome 4
VTLENFKSYAGRIHLQDINPGFVSIVGPNGCGKSNLLEALLFVMGRKVHHLRLNSSSDLIYRGSGPLPDHALVQVEFLRGTERVTLERMVLWNNSSVYRINHTEMSLREVRIRLKSIGIDLEHEHFAVLQGQVELLSTMKERVGYPDDPSKHAPEGLLEYFESLIGTRKYHYLLVAVQSELESMLEELPAALEGVRDMKSRKRELKEQAKDCGLYLNRELDWYKVGNVILQLQFQAQTASLAEAIQADTDLSNQLAQIDEQLRTHRTSHSQHKSRIQATRLDLQNLHSEYQTIQEKLEEFSCLGPLADKIHAFEERLAGKKEQLTQTIWVKTDLEGQVAVLTPDLSRSDASIQSLTSEITEMQNALLDMDSRTGGLRQARLKLDQANSQRRDCERDLNTTKEEYNSLLEEKRSEETHRKAGETDRMALFSRKETLESSMKNTESLLEDTQSRLNMLNSTLTVTRLKRDITTKLVTTLREDVSRREQMQNQAEKSKNRAQKRERVHQALRPLIDSGRLPDILGRLGDLASIPAEFDTAISTLFSGPLNSYVALRVEAAEQLLQYCKDLRLGRITVYVVEAIGENGCDKRYVPPEKGVLRLYDQLKIDPFKQYLRKVFYHVMRDTLVVNTLAEASPLVFHYSPRPTVVTKTGDIVRASGEMQGHAIPLHGLIRLSSPSTDTHSSPSDLTEGSMSELTARLKQQSLQQSDLEAQIHSLSLQFTNLSTQKEDLRTQYSLLRTDLTLIEIELRKPVEPSGSQKHRVIDLDNRLNRLKLALEHAKNRVESSTEACLQLQEDLESRRNPASKSLSESLCRAKVLLERVETEQITRFQELSNAKAKIETCNHTIYRLLSEINTVEKRMYDMTGELRRSEREYEENKRKFEHLKGKIEEMTEELEEVEGLERDLSDLIDATQGKKSKLGPKIRESHKEKDRRHLILAKTTSEMEENASKYAEKRKIYEEICVNLNDAELQSTARRQRASEKGYSQNLMEMVDNVPISDFITADHPYSQVLQNLQSLHSLLQTGLSRPIPPTSLHLYNSSVDTLKSAKSHLAQLYTRLGERRGEYERLRMERREQFGEGFSQIRLAFKSFYKLLLGETADADIEFVDIADPFASGIRISARPPSKSWKQMKVLSGGERTLVSLSLILAFHEYLPNAIYLLDEIDAALDFVNVQKVADLIRRKAAEAQFLVVSLHISLFERSEQLIGVYKPDISGNLSTPTRAVLFTPPLDSVFAKK